MVPLVKKAELEVADIADDNYVSLVLPNNSLKEDVKLPVDRDEAKKLKDAFEKNKDESTVYFTIIKACGQEKITAARVEKISAWLTLFGLSFEDLLNIMIFSLSKN